MCKEGTLFCRAPFTFVSKRNEEKIVNCVAGVISFTGIPFSCWHLTCRWFCCWLPCCCWCPHCCCWCPCCWWHPAIFGIPTVDDGVPAVVDVYCCYMAYRIIMFCLPVPTLIYLWEIYIFPGSLCPFCCRKICGPILGLHKSLTDTWMWKLGLRLGNSQRNT